MTTMTTARPTGSRVTVARDLARGGIITDETAMTIASWYASPGAVGQHLAALATTGTVDTDDLLDDIDRTLLDYGDDTDERDELIALAAWVKFHAAGD